MRVSKVKKIADGIIELPDGTVAFSLDNAANEIKKIKPVEYSVNDLILFLLYAQPTKPIRSRTAIFKELFLIERDLFAELLFRWTHVPGKDEHNLREFLSQKLQMHWVSRAKIAKLKHDGIRIHDDKNSATIRIDKEKTKAILKDDVKYSWKPLYTFFVRIKNGDVEILARKVDLEDCKFVPYFFGPYSFHVANKIDNLASLGLIEKTGKKNTNAEEFLISEKGKKIISSKYQKLDPAVRTELERLRQGLDQYGVDGILHDVYQNYDQFRTKSKIKNRYKLITWGRGKG